MSDRFLILGRVFRVVDCPHELTNDAGKPADAMIDHEQGVIWISPAVAPAVRPFLRRAALRQAQAEALRAMPAVS